VIRENVMSLEVDGERVIEEHYRDSPERYLIYLFHIVTYRFALNWLKDRDVLDYGCGSGYGTHFVAPHCRHITGVDISADAVAYATERYHQPNLKYRQIARAEVAPLPFDDASFDSVVSFQVIEHIADPRAYLSEIHRVLKPGGYFICATPDRSTRLLPGQKPWNVWHIREYDRAGLHRELHAFFPDLALSGMGGKPEVIQRELRRTRWTMWLTLPFTLPFMPERLRVAMLHWLKRLNRDSQALPTPASGSPDFGEADIFIAPEASPSVNLIAVARKP
jgi:SAM-dependent methyltransferase